MNNKYIQIEGRSDLVKDTQSGAILNIDNKALDKYRIERAEKVLQEKRMNKIENDVRSLKYMIEEIYKEIKK